MLIAINCVQYPGTTGSLCEVMIVPMTGCLLAMHAFHPGGIKAGRPRDLYPCQSNTSKSGTAGQSHGGGGPVSEWWRRKISGAMMDDGSS